MANGKKDRQNDAQVEDVDMELLTTAPDDWEFEVVADESPTRIVFETVGDSVVLYYLGEEHVVPENGDDPFDLYVFRGRDGKRYSLNQSYKLQKAFAGIEPECWVRVTYIKEIPVSKGNPLKDFKVEVRAGNHPAPAAR